MSPLIVMGMGRSGTRYFADVLSSHQKVLLHGEIPHSAMSKYFSLLDVLDKEHSRDKVRDRKWKERKSGFILDSFSSMAMGGGESSAGYLYVGHKTPRSEKFFSSYENHFFSAGMSPLYFYCMRNPFDVWSSYKIMPWNTFKSVKEFLDAYVASYDQYERCLKVAKGRVHPLNLCEYKRSENPGEFLKTKIFSHLVLDVDDGFILSLHSKENRNSSQNFLGKDSAGISADEYTEMMNDERVMKILNKYFPWMV